MKILEELKAAQEVINMIDASAWALWQVFDPGCTEGEEADSLAAVLRRIPQLIETIEWVKKVENHYKELSNKHELTDGEYGAWSAIEKLLSKLEGKKDE